MFKIILIVFIIYFIGTLILFGVDFYFYLIEHYCRFHIGRFDNLEKWKKVVINKGRNWMIHTPTVRITDNNRYILMDMLTGQYRSNVIQSWQLGSLILGLEEYKNVYAKDVERTIDRLIGEDGNFKKKPDSVDCGLLCYAILKGSDSQKVKPAMDYAANLIIENIREDGMIAYTNAKNTQERYVDTIGLVVPFLFLYSEKYYKPKVREIAFKQLTEFVKYGMEPSSNLPNHAYDAITKLPLGVYGWGRGCAWYCIGLLDSYQALGNGKDKEWIKNQMLFSANQYAQYQQEDGGFSYIVQMHKGYDSSVTAVMAYYYKKCYEIFGDKQYETIYLACLSKLKSVTRITGALDWCQGDTKGIGIFAVNYDIMPFAQGYLIRCMEGKIRIE